VRLTELPEAIAPGQSISAFCANISDNVQASCLLIGACSANYDQRYL
jgi:hypothetical protein